MAGIEEILGEHGENYLRASVYIECYPTVRNREEIILCSLLDDFVLFIKKKEIYCCFNSMIILEELDCYERKYVKEYNYQCLNNFLIFFSIVFIILITNLIFTFTT